MPALSIFNKKNPNPYSCKKRAPILAESNSSEVHWLFNAQFLRGSSTAAEAKSRFELRLKRLKKKIISQLQMFMLLFGYSDRPGEADNPQKDCWLTTSAEVIIWVIGKLLLVKCHKSGSCELQFFSHFSLVLLKTQVA